MKVVDSYAELARTRAPEFLAGPVLRSKSVHARAVYARLASGGACDYDQLIAALRSDGVPPADALNGVQKRLWLSELARVMAAQCISGEDYANAQKLFDAVVAKAGPEALDGPQQAIYGQLLYRAGEYDQADALLPQLSAMPEVFAEYLRMDLANPFVRPGQDEAAWLKLLNAPYRSIGLEPIELLPDGVTPFDRLTVRPNGHSADGPLVSVVMSAYRPSEHLHSAVRSILAQTWRNLELLVVDDASGPEFDAVFAEVAALDERVRVIRQESNGGTYVVRNAGIDAARGEFVTFQDSDDWSHPRRVEEQVTALLADPELIATRSQAVRAHDNLDHQWMGYPAQRMNASSLLFRREPVLAKVGYFDSVRKSADFEFAFRLEAAYGVKITDIPKPLAYTRLTQASLSRSDFTLSWAAGGRIAYQAAYLHWHRAVAGGASPYVPRLPEQRPFPAPPSYLRGIPHPEPRRHYDVLLLDDWVSYFDGVDGGIEQLRILTGRGLSVGIVHAEPVVRMSAKRRHVDFLVQDTVNSGLVDRVTLDQDVTASLLVVRDPAVLQFPPHTAATLRASKVVVCQPRQPVEYPGAGLAYDEQDVTEHVRAMFGVEPQWDPGLDGAPVELERWAFPRTRRRSDRPVIGQCAPDGAFSWPESQEDLLLAYPEFGEVDVRVLGGVSTHVRLRRFRAEAAHVVYRRDEISLRAFLNQLDFFVCFPSREVDVAPTELITLAMAAGAVCVLPERFEPQFGPAALYCTEADVVATVQKYYGKRYAPLVDAGRAYVRENHSADAYAERITQHLA